MFIPGNKQHVTILPISNDFGKTHTTKLLHAEYLANNKDHRGLEKWRVGFLLYDDSFYYINPEGYGISLLICTARLRLCQNYLSGKMIQLVLQA